MADRFQALAAGDLRHVVTLQAVSTAQDASGQPTSSWVPVLMTRASIRELSSRELNQSDLVTSQMTHLVSIRWTAVPLMAGMRLIYGSHTYLVQSVVDVFERHRVYELLCLEIDGTAD